MANLFYFLSLAFFSTATVYPGVRTSIGINTFNNLFQSFLPVFVNHINNSTVGDKLVIHRFLLKEMIFVFTNIQINEFNVDLTTINTELNTKTSEIILEINDLSMNISADFDLEWYGIYHGSTSISFSSGYLQLPVMISEKNNEIVFQVEPLEGTFQHMNFNFTSNNLFLSVLGLTRYIWPLNLVFNKLLSHTITHLSTQYNDLLTYYFNDLPYYEQLGTKDLAFDYRVLELEVASNTTVEGDIYGDFLVPSDKYASAPFTMNALINWQTNSDFKIQLTDYFFNSFLWALTYAGYLNNTITSMNSPNLSKYLTTSEFRLLVPGLFNTYGQMEMAINFAINDFPSVAIQNGQVYFSAMAISDFYVVGPDSQTKAFSIVFNISSTLNGTIEATNNGIELFYVLDLENTQLWGFSLAYTTIGGFSLESLQNAFNWVIQNFALFLNPNLAQGSIPLKLPKFMKLENPSFKIFNRVIEIGATPMFSFENMN